MGKRAYCSHCDYPQNVCICAAIQPLKCQQHIVVLQHPSEVRQAKNSARLLPLCLPQVSIFVGENSEDLAPAQHWLKQPLHANSACVFYPNPQSLALENKLNSYTQQHFTTLVFIDATWRKAYKMWQLNPWLQNLPSWHFASPPTGNYRIRKTNLNHALSTLEAVAYALQTGHKAEVAPLHQLFNHMQHITQRSPHY